MAPDDELLLEEELLLDDELLLEEELLEDDETGVPPQPAKVAVNTATLSDKRVFCIKIHLKMFMVVGRV